MENFETVIMKSLLEVLNVIKMYHWYTPSYPTHKATDKLYNKLSDHIDQYIEVMMGKKNTKVPLVNIPQLKIQNITDNEQLEQYAKNFIIQFYDLNDNLNEKTDTDLLNIRDEIIADINHFLYLVRLK